MEQVNFFTFDERKPKHGDSICLLLRESGISKVCDVVYPAVKWPEKFKGDYFVLTRGGHDVSYDIDDYYCEYEDVRCLCHP